MEAITVIQPAHQFQHQLHRMEKSGRIVPHVVELDDANIVAALANIAIPRMASVIRATPLEVANALAAEVREVTIFRRVNAAIPYYIIGRHEYNVL